MGNCFASNDAASPFEGRARHYLVSDRDHTAAESTAIAAPITPQAEDNLVGANGPAAFPLPLPLPAAPTSAGPQRRLRINSICSGHKQGGSGCAERCEEQQQQTPAFQEAPLPQPLAPRMWSGSNAGQAAGVKADSALGREEWVAIHEEFADDPDEILEQFQRNVSSHTPPGTGLSSPCASGRPHGSTNPSELRLRMSPADGLTQTDSADAVSYVSTWLDDQLTVRVRKDSPPASVRENAIGAQRLAGPYLVTSVKCPSPAGSSGHSEISQSQTQLKSPRPPPRKSPRHSRNSASSSESATPLRHLPQPSQHSSLSAPRTWEVAASVVENQLQE